MSTTYMNLDLPTPSVTLGPQWASDVNDAFDVVDSHDHSAGKGVKVKPNGMDINDNLDFQVNQLENVEAVEFSDLLVSLSGSTNSNKIYAVLGDLYWTNSSGTVVQITNGGSIVSSPGAASIFQTVSVSSNVIISSSDTFVYLVVDASATRTITLPLASSVTPGRIYIVKDATGQADTNTISVAASGSDDVDGVLTYSMDEKYGSRIFVSNGATSWLVS